MGKPTVPLFVDLDGTLLRTDSLLEQFISLVRQRPHFLLLIPFWLFRGKVYFKNQLARHSRLEVATLPYHPEVLAFLREEHAAGRPLILATGAHGKVAEAVATHLNLFTGVIATDAQVNNTGNAKLGRIKKWTKGDPFDYMGNSSADLPIWSQSREASMVSTSPRLIAQASRVARVGRIWDRDNAHANVFRQLLRAMRIPHWLKNLLLAVPLVSSHNITEPRLVGHTVLAMAAFSLAASAGYLINDFIDLNADRRHPVKRRRPLAAGRLPFMAGLIAIWVLLAGAAAISLALPEWFAILLAIYFLTTLLYSLWLKKLTIVDVLVVGLLHTLRIIAGCAALAVDLSFWLLGFSMFFFLNIALVKRYAELSGLRLRGGQTIRRRGYHVDDGEIIRNMGIASGYVAVLVLALYMDSDQIQRLYTHARGLWGLCPLVLYWHSRIWLKAHRGQLNEDPLIFAVTDRVSLTAGLLGLLILWLSA